MSAKISSNTAALAGALIILFIIILLIAGAFAKPLTFPQAFESPDLCLRDYLNTRNGDVILAPCKWIKCRNDGKFHGRGSCRPTHYTPYAWPGWDAHKKMLREHYGEKS